MPNHIIQPQNGYLEDSLLRLAAEYGDQTYIDDELPMEIALMGATKKFKIYNGNKFWSFELTNNTIWVCRKADQEITNPGHKRFKWK